METTQKKYTRSYQVCRTLQDKTYESDFDKSIKKLDKSEDLTSFT